MLKISTKHSLRLSVTLSVIFFIGCVVCAFFMPQWVNMLVDARDYIAEDITVSGRVAVMALAYAMLAVAVVADALLFRLLLRVCDSLVFTEPSVALIRGVAWCCFLLGALFFGLGFFFHISFAVAFAAVFLGMCLRVVKNVIEQAIVIKSENDLTV